MAWFRKSSPNSDPSAKKPAAPAVERLEARDQPTAAPLADLNTTSASPFAPPVFGPYIGGTPEAAVIGGSAYFAADDGTHQAAVWKSDGTAAGTKLVAVLPSATPPAPWYPMTGPSGFTAAGGKVFFTHDDGMNGRELWVTDGTPAGTRMVKDLDPGPGGAYPYALNTVGGKLVFVARTSVITPGPGTLFATDGTAAGTTPLRDLGPDFGIGFAATGGKLYFTQTATDPATGEPRTQLWATDGTAAGTAVFAALPAGVRPTAEYWTTSWAAAVGSKLYFAAKSDATGRELWVTDGTAAGTKLVRDVNPGPTGGDPGPMPMPRPGDASPANLTAVGGKLYFVADDGTHGRELWWTDGTAAGTKMATDLNPGSGSFYPTNPYEPVAGGSNITGLTAAGGKLYFGADAGAAGPQLYVTDGTAAGTAALTAVEHSPPEFAPTNPYGGAMPEGPMVLAAHPGGVMFTIGDKAHGRQLWATDGTKAGTRVVRQIGSAAVAGPVGPIPFGMVGGRLLFHADDGVNGRQLWATDGTEAGTTLVTRINPDNQGSEPLDFVASGGLAYFRANNGVYATDGASPPRLLKAFDRPPGLPGAGTAETADAPVASRGGAYFVSRIGATGVRLWRTDGTVAGTRVVKELNVDPDATTALLPSGIQRPTDVNGTLYFTVDLPDVGQQVWKTDGTAAGTVLVRQVNPRSSVPPFPWVPPIYGPPDPLPNQVRLLTAVGNRLYFVAGGAAGDELWVSDGTAAGTKRVADVNPGAGSAHPADLTPLSGKVYFTAFDGKTGRQLWASDGTAAGTKRVAVIGPEGPFDVPPPGMIWGPDVRGMVAAGGKLYFVGQDTEHGRQLWASDGTTAGTKRVSALAAASPFPWLPPDPGIAGLTAAGSKIYFTAADAETGRQVYVSDGTAAGTKMVARIGTGTMGVGPVVLAGDQGAAYFAADDGKHGFELWRTDGTAAGTKMVTDANPGPGSGVTLAGVNVTAAVVNRRVLFAADDGKHGSEPWVLTPPVTSPPPAPPSLPPGADRPALVASIAAAATEGTEFSGRLGSVTLPPGQDYRVTLLWGDGRSSIGVLTRTTPTGRAYTVSGSHTYADPGTYRVRATITAGGRNVLVFHTTATVADARFYAGRVAQRLAAGSPFAGVVATITDMNPNGKPSDFTATIDWGDGRTSVGTVRRTAAGKLEVVGNTTFAAAGRRAVTVTIRSEASGRSQAVASIFVIDPPRGVRPTGRSG